MRIPKLLETPAAVRFLSCEPLLGEISLRHHLRWFIEHGRRYPNPPLGHEFTSSNPAVGGGLCAYCSLGEKAHHSVDWIIVGGESGPGARPMHPDWARSLRDQCVAAGVPFFFKQWGEWGPQTEGGVRNGDICMSEDGDTYEVDESYICALNESDGAWLRRVGKKAAGRELDGRRWDEMPERAS